MCGVNGVKAGIICLLILLNPVVAAEPPVVYRDNVLTIPETVVIDEAGAAYYRDIRMVEDGAGNFRVAAARRGELARVDSVEVRLAGPGRVEVTAEGNKSVSCVDLTAPRVAQDGQEFTVVLAETTPASDVCDSILESFESTFQIDTGNLAPGEYTVAVNGVEAQFTLGAAGNSQGNGGNDNSREGAISSFEECVEAGYPTLDSYPRQCETPDDLRFMENLPEPELETVTVSITIQGEFICLPHWDTTGPQTMECAMGILTDSGDYYVLRDTDPSQPPVIGMSPTRTRVEVTGTLIPGSHERYQSLGTIEVEDFSEL